MKVCEGDTRAKLLRVLKHLLTVHRSVMGMRNSGRTMCKRVGWLLPVSGMVRRHIHPIHVPTSVTPEFSGGSSVEQGISPSSSSVPPSSSFNIPIRRYCQLLFVNSS